MLLKLLRLAPSLIRTMALESWKHILLGKLNLESHSCYNHNHTHITAVLSGKATKLQVLWNYILSVHVNYAYR